MKISGVPVKDADEPLTITITKSDVRLGTLKEAKSCAAANALCRQTGCAEARVHFARAYIKQKGKWVRFQVPDALRSEIIAFDRGGTFEPGEYILRPVTRDLRLDSPRLPGRSKKKNGKHPQKGNRPKRPYHVAQGVRARMQADWQE